MKKPIITVAVLLAATSASADDRLGAGYMMARPIAGESGGADHALVGRWERGFGTFDAGVAVEVGHSFGNADESLTRLAILPTLGFRSVALDPVIGVDIGLGWQLADGRTKFGGIPVSGSEHRGLRAELGISVASDVAAKTALRARAGLVLDGLYPRGLPSETRLGPFVELSLVHAL